MCIRDSTYTIVDGIEGRGQFVGVTLATGMNGNNSCWVEGEARMYLDDDPYPSIHYTGTEAVSYTHLKIAACLKHFAGYGAVNAGREYNDVEISQRTFLEQYVKPVSYTLLDVYKRQLCFRYVERICRIRWG